MCIKFNDLPKDIQNQIAKIHEEIPANKKLWERRGAALRGLEQNYKTDEPVFGAMYMTPFGTLIDCSKDGRTRFRSYVYDTFRYAHRLQHVPERAC